MVGYHRCKNDYNVTNPVFYHHYEEIKILDSPYVFFFLRTHETHIKDFKIEITNILLDAK